LQGLDGLRGVRGHVGAGETQARRTAVASAGLQREGCGRLRRPDQRLNVLGIALLETWIAQKIG